MYLFNTTTTVSFANSIQVMLPNQLKLSAKITQWPFASIQNTFQLLILSSVGDGSISSMSPIEDSQGVLRSFQMEVDGVPLYAQFFPSALLDGRVYPLSTSYSENGNSIIITTKTPVFLRDLVIDPNFAILLENSSPTKSNTKGNNNNKSNTPTTVIIAVVVSVVGAVMIVMALCFLGPKIHSWWKVRVDTEFSPEFSSDAHQMENINHSPEYVSPSKTSSQ